MHAHAAKPGPTRNWAQTLTLQRRCSGCGGQLSQGTCSSCGKSAAAQAATVNSHDADALERDADRAAEAALSAPSASPGVKGQAKNGSMQLRRLPSSSPSRGGDLPASVNQTLSESGRGLEPGLRQDMEGRFGYDFSRVRLHTGASAQQSTREVSAQAYTVGEHIAFGANRYAPGNASGRNLLAHELAHVVQQGRGGKRLQRRVLKEEGAAGCGICYGMAALAGIQAHKEIQLSWVLPTLLGAVGATRMAEVPLTCHGKSRRPDLVLRPSGNRWLIGSIKPARRSYYNDGANVFKMYSACIKASDPTATVLPLRVPMPRAIMPFPNPRATGCRTQTFSVNPPDEFGVYGYYCDPGRGELLRDPGCTCKKKKKKDKKKKKKKNKSKSKQKQKKSPKKGGGKSKSPKSAKPKAKIKPKAKVKPKIKPKKPKAPKGTAKPKPPKGAPKPKSAGGAGNVGFGLSLFSVSGGAGNAGVGISIASTSTAFGTAGAGVSILSDSVAAGAVGVGGTIASDGMGVAVAGAGGSIDSSSMAAGAAGAGTSESSEGMAAGAAGAGSVEDSELAGAGVAGHGEVKGSQVTGTAGTGSGKLDNVQGKGSGSADKPVDAKDVSGDSEGPSTAQAEGQQEGRDPTDTGDGKSNDGKGKGDATSASNGGTNADGKEDGKGDGTHPAGDGQPASAPAQDGGTGTGNAPQDKADGGAPAPGTDPGTGPAGGTPGPGAATGSPAAGGTADSGTPSGDLQARIEAGLAKAAPDSKPEDRAKAAAEAVKLNEILKAASVAQRNLLAKLAEKNGGQYQVPSSDWAKTLLTATEGITDADLQYLMTINWVPGHLSPAELRKRVLAVLKSRASQGAPGKKPAANGGEKKPAVDGKAGAGGKGPGTGAGTAAPGTEAPVGKQGENKDGVMVDVDAVGETKSGGSYTVARKFTGERPDSYEKNYSFLVDDSAINGRTKIGDAPVMTLHWIAEDGKSYYFRQQYRIKGGPFEETDKAPGSKTMLRFTLESANTDLIDISADGMEPFLLSPNRLATYRIFKP